MVEAIEDVKRIRPSPRATMSRTTYLARWTVERTLRSTSSSSCSRSVSANGPPMPMPAFSAAAPSGRPATRSQSCSTPSGVERSACTASTVAPSAWRSPAAAASSASSAATIRSKSWAANCLASSKPMPLEAPVTSASERGEEVGSMPPILPAPAACEHRRVRGRYDAVIAGGGHNGLVAAAYLARAGRSVLVLERREHPGGAAGSERPLGDVLEATFRDDVERGIVLTDGLIGTFAAADDPSLRQNRCFLYHVIGNGEGHWDVPVGGMGAVTAALARAAAAAGAELRTGAEVEAIETDGASAEVRWAGGRARTGHVLAN